MTKVVDTVRETDLLVCARVTDFMRPPVTSVIGHCEECEAEVWVAISSPVEPRRMCLRCVNLTIGELRKTGVITARQAAEIRAHRGKR